MTTNMLYIPQILEAQEAARAAGKLVTVAVSADEHAVRAIRQSAEGFEWDGADLIAYDLTAERPWKLRVAGAR